MGSGNLYSKLLNAGKNVKGYGLIKTLLLAGILLFSAPAFSQTITGFSGDMSACAGDNVSFFVTTTPVTPGDVLTYQWQVSTDGGSSFGDIPAATDSTYTITSVPVGDDGNFYTVVVTEAGATPNTDNSFDDGFFSFLSVSTPPSAITGTGSVCPGGTITLGDPTLGGTWSSASTGIATVGVSSGIVTGVSGGSATISYTDGSGCAATAIVTVNPSPATISGTLNVCVGATTTLTDGGGGTWSSTSGHVTVNSSTGDVTGVSNGIATITYTLPTGCIITADVTVNPLPGAITGTLSVCIGATTALTDAGGGTWNSGDNGIATVVTATGVVTGVSANTVLISYTLGTGCITTATVTVNPLPDDITGTLTVCAGSTTALTDAGGGTWTSGNTSVATVVPGTGAVWGVSSGTATINYTISTGCKATAVVTVNPLPGTITGTKNVCIGFTTALTDAGGGTWASGSTSVATVDPSTGVVTGVTAGTATIIYTLSTGCNISTVVTVNPVPGAITGTPEVCAGSTTNLGDPTPFGQWSSSNTAIATVGSGTGTVSGVAGGTVTINYSLSVGCTATVVVTVDPLPTAILGTTTICGNATTALSDATGTGTWSSSSTSVATVDPTTGVVTGVAPGTTVITYTISTGCGTATTVVTVNAGVGTIAGNASICGTSSTTLTDASGGGTWSSSAPSVATIDPSTGLITGVTPGTTTITYNIPATSGCSATLVVTVSATPAISGTFTVCGSSTTTLGLTAGPAGGTWSSSNTSAATIDPTTGLLTGVAPGTSTITYATTGAGCTTTQAVTDNATPAISGTFTVCGASTTTLTLSAGVAGGTWTSSTTSVATIGSSSGLLTGVAPGTSTITYSTPGAGCTATQVITDNATPVISGNFNVCGTSTTTLGLSAGATGGTWSSSNTSAATIDPTTGLLTGVAPGTSTITYTVPGAGCIATQVVTASASPAITGTFTVCGTSTTTLTLSAGPTGGSWSSSNTSAATIGSGTGLLTGVAPGTSTITYTTGGAGCTATQVVTDNATPVITGTFIVCGASTTTLSLSAGLTGGTWSSSNTSAATVDPTTGLLTGVAPGTSIITYTTPGAGCTATQVVTDNATPAISGTFTVCGTSTTTLSLSAGVTGGTWTSGTTATATIGSASGLLTGVAPGTSTITYTTTGAGCTATQAITDNATPAISGTFTVCGTSTTTLGLSVGATGGVWSSSNTSAATIDPTTGLLTGVAPGTSTITYTVDGAGCMATQVVTDNATPVISGTFAICGTSTTTLTLSAGATGGTWSSSNTSAATIDPTTGLLTGVAPGTSIITYTITGAGCTATQVVTDNAAPAISGTFTVCGTSTTTLTLSAGTTGGTWSSSNTSAATIGSSSGLLTGVAPGTSTITYSLGVGCTATQDVTDNATPVISGNFIVCGTSTTTLTLSTGVTGGTWSSSNTSAATIDPSTGLLTGVAPGTSTITYTTTGIGCTATQIVTDNTIPAITGTFIVCGTSTTTLGLSAGITGGTWSSGTTAVATIGSSSGLLTGVAPGTSTITYTTPGAGCIATQVATDNAVPAITGTFTVCGTSTTTLGLSVGATGGVWTSSNTSAATIDPTTGLLTGVAPGTSTITYTASGVGCTATQVVTDNTTPAISGTFTLCGTSTTTLGLSAGITGGTWSSSNTSAATIDPATGLLTGVAPGTSTITYTTPGAGCTATQAVTISATPVISGTFTVCGTAATTLGLTAGPAGGTWSSSNTSAATIGSSSAILTGVAPGISTITYTATGIGCTATQDVTDNATPAISGTFTVCGTSTTTLTLSAGVTGGAWSSSNTSAATIDPSTGLLTGVAPGISTITYTTPGAGCTATQVVTDNATPAISGTFTVCGTSTTTLTLSAGITGGTWSSSNTSAATIDPTTGLLTGVAPGTSTITYTTPGVGCTATQIVTDNATPAISGTFTICGASTTTLTLSAGATGGTWSSGTTSVATIGSSSGLLTGVAPGTSIITYTASGVGCSATQAITDNATPAISGTSTVCGTSTTTLTLSAGITGGTWSSSNTSAATIDPTTGLLTGVAPGTSTITYTTPGAGCTATQVVTDNATPAISGIFVVCGTSTTTLTLSAGITGGTWSSSNTSAATIDPTTGLLTGVAPGTSTITYTTPGVGCTATQIVTDNTTPAISGIFIVCGTSTTTLGLSAGITGGTWSSGNTAAATIDPTTGLLTGVAPGMSTITYTTPGAGCTATQVVTDNATPAITGSATICESSTTTLTLSAGITGGTWSSSDGTVATVGSTTGVVTGLAAGSATIAYTTPGAGCSATFLISVNLAPSPITGTFSVCGNGSTTLHDGSAGGTWSSSTTSVASIGSSTGTVVGGNLTSVGTTTISYTLGSGCVATVVFTDNPSPANITPLTPVKVCVGLTTTLADVTAGGTWASSNTSLATVGSTGIVTGVAGGAPTITYTLAGGCNKTKVVSVNAAPAAISGSTGVCMGSTTSLTEGVGGTWSSSTTGVATVVIGSGLVTPVSPGTTTITFTATSTTCTTSTIVTVNPLPGAITVPGPVCVGSVITLTDAGGGTWSSHDDATATVVSASGDVTGVGAGTIAITYTLPTGCSTTATVSVNPLPGAITGTASVCVGLTTALTDAGGGAWSSNSPSVATVDGSGVVTGVSSGNATIKYTLPTGCFTTIIVTVNPLPGAISVPGAVCVGSMITLTDGGGGTWISGDGSVATIDISAGTVTGVGPGTVLITYTLPTGCLTTTTVTVNPLPASITGTASACMGLTSALTDAGGGTWSSSSTSVATVDGAGNVTGVSVGSATITYTLPTGCFTITTFVVNPLPAAISGATSVCVGSTTALSDGTPFGSWSSSNNAIATVGSGTGIVSGVSAGTATITYTLGTGCDTTLTITVNPLPTGILGTLSICGTGTTTLTDATASGTWSSSNSSIATVGSVSGIVTGVTPGTVTITYTLLTGCGFTNATVTVNPLPVVAAITGTTTLSTAITTTLSDATAGGIWTSGTLSVATVGSTTGIVSGVSAGSSIISYTVTSLGCSSTVTTNVTVNNPLTGLSFDGSDDFISIPANASIPVGNSSYTIEAWIKPNSGGNLGIVGWGNFGATDQVNAFRTNGATQLDNYWWGNDFAVTVPNLADGNWHHVAATYDGTNRVIYSDGIFRGQDSPTGHSVPSAANLAIGSTDFAEFFSGSMDEVRIWNVALTQAQIQANMNCDVAQQANLVAYYRLEDGIAGGTNTGNTTATDYSGNGNCGTLTNFSLTGASSNYVTGAIGSCNTITMPTAAPTNSSPICITGTVTLTAHPGGGATSFAWSSAGGFSSASPNPTATPTVTTTYSLTPGSSSGLGCTVTTIVSVNPTPTAAPTNDGPICATGTVTLTAHQSGTVTTYLWSDGGSFTATVQNPTASPTSTDTYSLTVTDGSGFSGCNSGPYTTTATVNTIAVAPSNSSPACAAGTVNLLSGETGTATGVTYLWNGPGVFTSTLSGPTTNTAGTYTVTATGTGSGCTATGTTTVTINATPVISGAFTICGTSTTTLGLSAGLTGGAWSSSNTAAATIDPTTGLLTGVAPGTSTITYTNAGSGCTATQVVTINATPVISGVFIVCGTSTSTLTLSAGVTGGTWSSSNTAAATIDPTTGLLTGAAPDTSTITYITPGVGCTATQVVTDNATPVISGTFIVCGTSTTTLGLGAGVSGGTWSSSNTGAATIDPTTGLLTGVAPGTSTITYTTPGIGCSATQVVTDNPTPVIGGTFTVCGTSSTPLGLTAGITGGGWSSGNTAAATIGLATGILNGVAPGTSSITYTTAGAGCFATQVITDNPTPVIGGTFTVCGTSSTPLGLTAGITGGGWSSSNTAAATIGLATGILNGVAPGTSTITYTTPGAGCFATQVITDNPTPVIGGTFTVCGTSSTPLGLTAGITGGGWSSSNTAAATIGLATGILNGVAPGTSTITYTTPGAGCFATQVITDNPTPVIGGTFTVCGTSSTPLGLTAGITGGGWSSSNTAAATIGLATGILNGVAPGTSTITYTTAGAGCFATQVITDNPTPVIGGTFTVCGTSSTPLGLTAGITGGGWSSSNTAAATIGLATGILNGVAPGTSTITYTTPGAGCFATQVITDNPTPVIGGTFTVCGTSSTPLGLTAGITGGGWSSSNTAAATIGLATGILNGVAPGTSTITYTTPGAGCFATQVVTDNAVPVISGTFIVCGTSSTTLGLTAGITGGGWSSSNTAVATIGLATGILNGVAPGTSTITYTTAGAGCFATQVVTDNPTPVIGGTFTVCGTSTTTLSLSAGITGGTWSSSNTSAATIDPTTGLLTGVAPGTSTITYTTPGAGCSATQIVTDNATPVITGTFIVCGTSTTTLSLSAGVTGGTWSSSNTSAATVDPTTGLLTGVAPGTSIITYTTPGIGCSTTQVVTDNPTPVITGAFIVCGTSTTTLSLSAGITGGTWSSSNTSAATIDPATGLLTGVAPGTSIITYTTPGAGCSTTQVVTDNATPVISGTFIVCDMSATTLGLGAGITGGTWSSSNTSAATIGSSSGLLTGVAPGTSTITYITPGVGCSATQVVTDNPTPVISGTFTVCGTSSTTFTLSAGITGGAWSSSNTAAATIDPTTGLLTGVAPGTSTITYTTPGAGCSAAQVVTVNSLTVAPSNSSPACVGDSVNLLSGESGTATGVAYSWSGPLVYASSLSNPTLSSVTTSMAGVYTVTATASGIGCTATGTTTVTINPLPVITATATPTPLCVGNTLNLNSTPSGGSGIYSAFTWNGPGGFTSFSQDTTNPNITLAGAGVYSVMVTDSKGCKSSAPGTTVSVFVNDIPKPITGIPELCLGFTTSLVDSTAFGSWSSSNTSVATIGSGTGIVSSVSLGTTTISYSLLGTGCFVTTIVTVNPLPALHGVTGGGAYCAGGTGLAVGLNGSDAGINYQLYVSGVSTGGAVAGTGLSVSFGSQTTAGTYNVVATNTVTGCMDTMTGSVTIVINPLPGPIVGNPNVCVGLTTDLSDTTAGGTWSSTTTSVATIGSTGTVGGVTAGTSAITYTLPTGCIATTVVTVNPLPGPITGASSVCVGSTTNLGDVTPFGEWTSSNTASATVGSISGIVTGVTEGTTNITYTLATGCIASASMTVNPVPTPVTVSGGGIFCGSTTITASGGAGGTIYFEGTTPFDTSTAFPSTSQFITTTGQYYFRAETIAGCWSIEGTTLVTISAPATADAGSPQTICTGGSVTLAGTIGGSATHSVWSAPSGTFSDTTSLTSSYTPSITSGTVTLTLTTNDPDGTGPCPSVTSTVVITVNPSAAAAPTNTSPICARGTATLNANAAGGVGPITYSWSGPNLSSLTDANPTATPSVTSTYSLTVSSSGSGCSTAAVYTTTVTVNTIAVTPTNTSPACVGGTVDLSAGESGTATGVTYSWHGPAGFLSPSPTPSLTTITTGMAGIYTVTATGSGDGCTATATTTVTVNTLTVSPSNNSPACVGGTVTLSSGELGTAPGVTYLWNGPGVYTSTLSGPSLTSITTGMAGTYTVTATAPGSGCSATATTTVTVNTLTVSPSNNSPACVGGTVSLSSGELGTAPGVTYLWNGPGVYTSTLSGPSLTSITTGMAGTYTVTATAPGSGCTATATTTVTVNTLTISPSNTSPACVGGTVNLSSGEVGTAPGVTYLWNGPAVYTSTLSGPSLTSITTGMAGTYTVTATAPGSGCSATATTTVTVNTLTVSPSNSSPACVGGTVNLSSGEAGTATGVTYLWNGPGSYTSTVPGPSLTSITTGMAGTYTVTATAPGSGCTATATTTVTVNTLTVSPSNTSPACVGGTVSLASGEAGTTTGVTYLWHGPAGYTNTASGPSLTSVTAGMAGVYTVTATAPGSGCIATATTTVTVNTLTVSPSNNGPGCVGGTITLSSGEGGTASGVTYSWNGPAGFTSTLSGPSLTSITGAMAGTYTVTATAAGSGCSATGTTTVTVNPAVAAITGIFSVCGTNSTTLADGTSGGTWSSNNTGIATIGSGSGTITGVTSGTVVVTYTTSGPGCTATHSFTVNPVSPITGSFLVCVASSTTLSDAAPGGTWSSSNTSIATVGTSGTVRAIAPGTAVITYSLPTGCSAAQTITVNAVPVPIRSLSPSGFGVCIGSTISLAESGSGTWSSSNTSWATVGSSSGVVMGVAVGSPNITYTQPGIGCTATAAVTVNPLPAPISGATFNICGTSTITVTDATSGGRWSSSNSAVATVGSAISTTAGVTGVSTGTLVITYSLPSGCAVTHAASVNPNPVPIRGNAPICVGTTITLNESAGGTWSSSNPAQATIGVSTGLMGGVASGNPVISYTLSTGCFATVVATVTATPDVITGLSTVAVAATITLSDAEPGGTWSSSAAGVASVGSTGIVRGVSVGSATITYTLPCGFAIKPISVTAHRDADNDLTSVEATPATSDIHVLPNPNKGLFTIKGTLGTTFDQEVSLEITDMLGQVIYNDKVVAHNGDVDQRIQLNNNIANGMYILTLRSGAENKVFHIVVEQ